VAKQLLRPEKRNELAPFQLIELHSISHEPAAHGTISDWQGSVRGHSEHNEDFATDQRAYWLLRVMERRIGAIISRPQHFQ
jgi:hypothetical protein